MAGLLAAQEPSKPDDAHEVLRATFKFILVPVTVTESLDGSFLNGLTPLDFHLTDNGQPQKISEDVTSHPLSMVVAIQANSDVEKILPTVKRLSSVFEALVLGDNGELAVMAFDHRVTTLTDFTSEPAKIDAAFKKLTPGSYSSNLERGRHERDQPASGSPERAPARVGADR